MVVNSKFEKRKKPLRPRRLSSEKGLPQRRRDAEGFLLADGRSEMGDGGFVNVNVKVNVKVNGGLKIEKYVYVHVRRSRAARR